MTSRAPVVTAEELLKRDSSRLRFVDGSWFLGDPDAGSRAFGAEHIPGAVHFPIDGVCRQDTDLPHMLPTPERFAEWASGAGIGAADHVIVYDVQGLFSAARVWWTFEAMGAENVRVLNGGLPAWKAAGGPITGEIDTWQRSDFEVRPRPSLVVGAPAMKRHVEEGAQILDARPRGRFEGSEPEPRAGLASGHMPGARNLPVSEIVVDGRLLEPAALRRIFGGLGLEPGKPVVTTCGSGVTAALLALALRTAGFEEVAVYDGSWAEWGADPDCPVETGPGTH